MGLRAAATAEQHSIEERQAAERRRSIERQEPLGRLNSFQASASSSGQVNDTLTAEQEMWDNYLVNGADFSMEVPQDPSETIQKLARQADDSDYWNCDALAKELGFQFPDEEEDFNLLREDEDEDLLLAEMMADAGQFGYDWLRFGYADIYPNLIAALI